MHFKDALKRDGVNIIAEFKRASPSLGDIDVAADPVAKAKIYEAGGAAAMSVLCDAARFKGSVEDLRRVAASGAKIPLLAKDFISEKERLREVKDFISEKERLREVKDAGASAALLIVRYLDDAQLAGLLAEARGLGLDALVETHSEEEIKRAVAVGADIIGVNCRDLSNFTVDVSISERLLKAISWRGHHRRQLPRPFQLHGGRVDIGAAAKGDPGRNRQGRRERHQDERRHRTAQGGGRERVPDRHYSDEVAGSVE